MLPGRSAQSGVECVRQVLEGEALGHGSHQFINAASILQPFWFL